MIAVADTDGDHLVSFSDVANLWHQVWNSEASEGHNLQVSFSGRYK
jgi:hypothetical protein